MSRLHLFGLVCLLPVYPAAAQTTMRPDGSDTTLIYGEVPPVCAVEAESPFAVVQLSPGLQPVTNVVYT